MFILFVIALFIVESRSQKKRLPIHALRIMFGFVSYEEQEHSLQQLLTTNGLFLTRIYYRTIIYFTRSKYRSLFLIKISKFTYFIKVRYLELKYQTHLKTTSFKSSYLDSEW